MENRKYTLCDSSQIGDEYHYNFECNSFNQKRNLSLSIYFINRHNIIKFSELTSSKRKPLALVLVFVLRALSPL